ncbi:hypothetical protein K456DRAFT_314176 [Colletotrichum gloeosporioides 23]|nr:hypothetical protein K456DRAFT_314176 [Colletotrichum gloeosporioides 23]
MNYRQVRARNSHPTFFYVSFFCFLSLRTSLLGRVGEVGWESQNKDAAGFGASSRDEGSCELEGAPGSLPTPAILGRGKDTSS